MGVASHEETIVAIASPHGSGARGIVRLSGSNAVSCAANIFVADNGLDLNSLTETSLVAGSLNCDGDRVPGNLLVWPTEKSFTRQPAAEFHTFGSTPLLELVVEALCRQGARPAEPGEFTMRAFLSGRLDLTQAEAVLAVIDARDRKQLGVAIDQLAGGVGNRLGEMRKELIAALAELEAGLDFVEEDIEFISKEAMLQRLRSARQTLERLLSQISSRGSANETFRASLFGLPNAGKSSLFNRMVGRELAIVSNVSGTTTDRVSQLLELEDQRIELVDTAGLEFQGQQGSIAFASQQQRRREILQCDLAILCIAVTENVRQQLDLLEEFDSKACLVALTQADRIEPSALAELKENIESVIPDVPLVVTSAANDTGVEELGKQIGEKAIQAQTSESAIVGSTLVRTSQSLSEAQTALVSAISAAQSGIGEEVIAAEVRSALDCIGLVVGTIYTDDILDVVFGKFCIGK